MYRYNINVKPLTEIRIDFLRLLNCFACTLRGFTRPHCSLMSKKPLRIFNKQPLSTNFSINSWTSVSILKILLVISFLLHTFTFRKEKKIFRTSALCPLAYSATLAIEAVSLNSHRIVLRKSTNIKTNKMRACSKEDTKTRKTENLMKRLHQVVTYTTVQLRLRQSWVGNATC
jgi:hypothetical protein